MLITEFQPTHDALQNRSTSRFGLRVRYQSEDYLIDLSRGKTMVGSSPRCNVRIQRPGVQPLHCLVDCDGDGLTIRRWAADALLNGQPFDEARLAVGDHLSLGQVGLEVIEDCAEEPAGTSKDAARFLEPTLAGPRSEPATFTWGKDTIHHTTVWVGEEEVESPAEVVPANAAREVYRQLQIATATSRSRSRKLLDALRASRNDNQSLSAQIVGLTNTKDELVAEHAALARELTMVREQLATAEQRYAEWDHQSNQWEALRKDWDTARAQWDNERTEWMRQVGEWEARLAGHVSRIEQLEAQLAAEQDAGQVLARAQSAPSQDTPPAMSPSHGETENVSPPAAELRSEVPVADAAFDRTTDNDVSATATLLPATDASSTENFAAGHMPSTLDTNESSHKHATPATADAAEAQVPAVEPAAPADEPLWERLKPTWENESSPWEDHGPAPAESEPTWEDRNRQSDPEFPELPQKPETDALPVVAQPAEPKFPAIPATIATTIESIEPDDGDSTNATAKPKPKSYIARFAHLFTDDETAEQPRPMPTAPAAAVDSVLGKPRNAQIVRSEVIPATAQAEVEEESIEDYMAKLMQRVRGDRPNAGVSYSEQTVTATGPKQPTSDHQNAAREIASAEPSDNSTAQQGCSNEQAPVFTDLTEMVRKSPAEQPADLETLRALANETARHAIGVYATKQHRRDAVTKFIVASLAGMTSVWLMMLAPDWRDLQFLTACLSLVVAAYWAGQTYATLVEMHRAGEYDGPEDVKVDG